MDAQTLIVVNSAISLVMTLTMLGLFLASRIDRCLLHWTLAGAGFLATSCLSLLHSTQDLHYLLGPPLGNALLLGSYLFLFSGVCHYLKKPLRSSLLVWLLVFTYLLNLTDFARADLIHRLLLNYPLHILINLATVVVLLRAQLSTMKAAVMVFVAILSLNIGQLLLRFVFFLIDHLGWYPLSDNPFIHNAGTMGILLFMLIAMTSCLLLLVRQKTLELQQVAEKDPLTGWLNRQSLARRLEAEWQRCQRLQQPLSILAFDIDHFKQVNDRFGHPTGDCVLQQVTSRVAEELRGYDLQFRMGGEEFIVGLPNVTKNQLQQISERVRHKIAHTLFADEKQLSISVSVGCATSDLQQDWQQLLEQADKALYQAKQQGRNRVIHYQLPNLLSPMSTVASHA